MESHDPNDLPSREIDRLVSDFVLLFDGWKKKHDLGSRLAFTLTIDTLDEGQVSPMVAILRENGLTEVQTIRLPGQQRFPTIICSEVTVHSRDSYAARVRKLAEIVWSNGCTIVGGGIDELHDWEVGSLSEE